MYRRRILDIAIRPNIFFRRHARYGRSLHRELAATHRFVVYNRNNKGLNISRISLSGENARLFRLNVDGFAGTTFSDVEIRAKDSIFVYVDVNLPENGTVDSKRVLANIDFSVNGIGSSLPLAVTGRDIIRMKGHIVTSDEIFEAGRPYRLIDSLVVAPAPPSLLLPAHNCCSTTARAWTYAALCAPKAPPTSPSSLPATAPAKLSRRIFRHNVAPMVRHHLP